ncbi:IFN-response element binding factor, putative [Ixodes scapularis]|uniref:IFN-response element binding factor, putative n=1 Tax=Ixodes scapularis TaxID=6945 RepID=B7P4D0_IXOSC|nr:IFN-response element binding factor, putative [Ixodes scapularis]|eukprot:XP_002405861.1 IFN-response element binding factor, putative [Ixodes scapularis]
MSYGRGPPTIDGMTSLKVDNLTYRTTPEDLKRVFEKYGDVGDVYIPRHPYTRDSRGFAFVRFYDKRDGEDAMDALDGYILDGRELRVQMARYGLVPGAAQRAASAPAVAVEASPGGAAAVPVAASRNPGAAASRGAVADPRTAAEASPEGGRARSPSAGGGGDAENGGGARGSPGASRERSRSKSPSQDSNPDM